MKAVIAIVRGEMPVAEGPDGIHTVPVTAQDLARGFLHHLGRPTLRGWACYVVMADLGLPDLYGDENREALLDNIHAAANNWPLDADARAFAEVLLGGTP